MPCNTIKFKVFQESTDKPVRLEVYRPYGICDEWMRVDFFNDMSVEELRCLTEYLIYIFNKGNKSNATESRT